MDESVYIYIYIFKNIDMVVKKGLDLRSPLQKFIDLVWVFLELHTISLSHYAEPHVSIKQFFTESIYFCKYFTFPLVLFCFIFFGRMLFSLLKMESWIQFNLEKVGKSRSRHFLLSLLAAQMVETANSSYRERERVKGECMEMLSASVGEENLYYS